MLVERFSGETVVANGLRSYLVRNKYEIVQLVTPGGQVYFSISWRDADSARRTCFPDLLAVRGDEVIVGELKARYSEKDKKKLLTMAASEEARKAIVRACSRALRRDLAGANLVFALVHADPAHVPDDVLDTFLLGASGRITRVGPSRHA